VTARAHDNAAVDALIAPVEAEIRGRLGNVIYGVDDQSLESVVVNLLKDRTLTVTAAESCSGGLIAKRITDVPDASRVFNLGLITYSNEAKRDLLHVPQSELEQYGAVSPQVAKSMAKGALRLANADIAVSVTGVAGPSGGSAEKPVGTVHVGIAWDGGAVSEHHHFLGRRVDIAQRASQAALALMRLLLIDPGNPLFRQA
jgi:nicotinamide-nucleotide amidase